MPVENMQTECAPNERGGIFMGNTTTSQGTTLADSGNRRSQYFERRGSESPDRI